MEHVEVPLTQGRVALIDPDDAARVLAFKWCAQRTSKGQRYYAVASIGARVRRERIHMHRLVANAPDGWEVDHINGDGLDDRKANLRIATRAENCRNRRGLVRGKSSQFKGVCYRPEKRRWIASIFVDGKSKHLGSFKIEQEAAKAYDDAAIEAFGEFACTNADLLSGVQP